MTLCGSCPMLTNDYSTRTETTDGPNFAGVMSTLATIEKFNYLPTVVITNMITNVRLQRKHVIRALSTSTDGGQDQPLPEAFALSAGPSDRHHPQKVLRFLSI